ncbi:MAG: 50S ribosomal protein L24 [Actinomycetes bacterium]|jgi:large subunit ribosomal protein L24
MASIKKGDTVILITGKTQARGGDRGKTGTVLSVDKEKNRVIVEGLNLVKKHVRITENARGVKDGGIVTEPAPIHISNVALIDPSTKKATRIGSKVEIVTKNGKTKTVRTRIAVKSGKEI